MAEPSDNMATIVLRGTYDTSMPGIHILRERMPATGVQLVDCMSTYGRHSNQERVAHECARRRDANRANRH